MTIATDPKAVTPESATAEEVPKDAADGEALVWLPIEGAIEHLKQMGLPYSRATIYRNYARDELESITHFGLPITDEEPTTPDREIADSEVVDDGESHITMLPHPPSIATQDLAAEFAEDRSRLLRMLESQERVIESQARTIEVQQIRLGQTDDERAALAAQIEAQQLRLGESNDERAALAEQMLALQAAPKEVVAAEVAPPPVAEPTPAEAPQPTPVPTTTAATSPVTIRGQAKRWYEFWR